MGITRVFSAEQIIEKLLGKIEPIGESNYDHDCLMNIDDYIILIDALVFNIREVSDMRNHYQESIKRCVEKTDNYLKAVKNSLVEYFEEIEIK